MRARNIKPGFFENEVLGQADPIVCLLFAGLWCIADKAGRLEDRPMRIKAQVFPYREGLDINGYLTELERLGFIQRYVVGSTRLIQVLQFEKHQHPHHTERESELPEFTDGCELTVKQPLIHGDTPSDSLIPDSLIPDSLIPDSPPTPKGELPPSAPVVPAAVSSGKRPRRSKVETMRGYSEETRRVVNTLGPIWPFEGNTPDAEKTSQTDTAAFCLRVSALLDAGNDPDLLIEAAKDYFLLKKKKFSAPQFFFGVTGYGGKGDAPCVGHMKLILTKRQQKATEAQHESVG